MAENTRSIEMIYLGVDEGNVVDLYNWSASLSPLARKEVPYIEITEFQQNLSSITQSLNYFASTVDKSLGDGGTSDPYAGLYGISSTERGNTYKFPYLNNYHHNITNSWGENKGVIGSSIKALSEAITSIAKIAYPSAGIEGQKTWEGSTPATYNFTFHLLNTINPKKDIKKNTKLIHALINNNLLDKMDFVALRPPAICQVWIPGVRAVNVAVMNNINIQNIGQMNRMSVDGKLIMVPDAYEITINIQELLTESRQIWDGGLAGGVVFSTTEGELGFKDPGNQLARRVTSLVPVEVPPLPAATTPQETPTGG